MQVELKPGTKPVAVAERARALNTKYALEARKQGSDLLEHVFIRKCDIPFASPIICVVKKNGEVRFCIDYRNLNQCTVRASWPLPKIDDMLKRLGSYEIFSKLDIRSAFWHIGVAPEHQNRLAFVTPDGQYTWTRMTFGFCNSPAFMQKAMNVIFGDLSTVLVYLDDLLIMSPDESTHLDTLREVLNRLIKHNIKLSWAKCAFFQTSFDFLGFRISNKGVDADATYVRKLLTMQQTTYKKSLASFVGMVQWINKFIPNLADSMVHLNKLRRKSVRWKWGPAEQEAFDTIRKLVSEVKWLQHPYQSKEYHVQCDDSDFAIGATLMQDYEVLLKPIEFISKALSDTQRNWTTRRPVGLGRISIINGGGGAYSMRNFTG